MRTIAVAMQKGGTGKTSTVVNLAAALAARKRSILVVDMDSQHNCTDWLEVNYSAGLYDVLTADGGLRWRDFIELIEFTGIEGIKCVPGGPMLARVEAELTSRGAPGILKSVLPSLRLVRPNVDYCLIDCPPGLGLLSLNGLVAADEVLAPAVPNSMSIAGLGQLLQTVETVRARANPGLAFRVLLTRHNSRTRHAREVEGIIRKQFGKEVFRTTVRHSVRMEEAFGLRQSIFEVAPNDPISEEFRALASEVEKKR